MNVSNAHNSNRRINEEQTGVMFDTWSEDDFEELEVETPWEIFTWEINNWASLNISSLGSIDI